jgi:hypothetical protein
LKVCTIDTLCKYALSFQTGKMNSFKVSNVTSNEIVDVFPYLADMVLREDAGFGSCKDPDIAWRQALHGMTLNLCTMVGSSSEVVVSASKRTRIQNSLSEDDGDDSGIARIIRSEAESRERYEEEEEDESRALPYSSEEVNTMKIAELVKPVNFLSFTENQFTMAILRLAETDSTYLDTLEREGHLTHSNPTVVGQRDMHIFDELSKNMHAAELQAYLDLWVATLCPPNLHEMQWVRYVRNLYFGVAQQIWDPLQHGDPPGDLTDDTDVFALMGKKGVSPITVAQTFMQNKLQGLRGFMAERGMMCPVKPDNRVNLAALNKLSESLHTCYNGMVMMTRARVAHDSSKTHMASSTMLFESSSINMDDLGPVQKLLLFLLDEARRKGYRKLDTEVYKPHYNEEGQFTYDGGVRESFCAAASSACGAVAGSDQKWWLTGRSSRLPTHL